MSDQKANARLYRASMLAKREYSLFARVVADSYIATSFLRSDYPDFFQLYWTKYVPGIIDGTREIIAAYIDGRIAGVVILKKNDAERERKICTLYVLDEFRRKGLATALLSEAFVRLGTTRPLITIADYKVGMFESIIKKYRWRKTQVLDVGRYTNHSKEFVYNEWRNLEPKEA